MHRRMKDGLLVGVLSLLFVCGAGCSEPQVSGESIATAQQSYDQATSAFENGSYSEAKTGFDAALAAGGLTVDQLVDAYLKRSMCLAAAGDHAAAEQDIASAAEGATDMEWVHIARGFLKAQQGDTAGAEVEYREAKKLNPKVVIPKAASGS